MMIDQPYQMSITAGEPTLTCIPASSLELRGSRFYNSDLWSLWDADDRRFFVLWEGPDKSKINASSIAYIYPNWYNRRNCSAIEMLVAMP
jgi:hypothetical protein